MVSHVPKSQRSLNYVIGIDISTQTVTAMLIGVAEEGGEPSELAISQVWTASRPYAGDLERRNPAAWVGLVRECILDLKAEARETELAAAIGLSTTFPGCFPILADASVDPHRVSLYDNTDDVGISAGGHEQAIARAEADTLNRASPGCAAIGLAHLVRSCGLRLEDVAQLATANTAFGCALLCAAGCAPDPRDLVSDFTETTIGGLYDARTGQAAPESVIEMLTEIVPEADWRTLSGLLPRQVPAWRNVVPDAALPAVRDLLELPNLAAVSVGSGDSPAGALAVYDGPDTVITVRGSTDSPLFMVERPRGRASPRETVFHYPLASAAGLADSPWCVTAPTLRSGKVWDWVKRLRFADGDPDADSKLEALALDALKRRLRAPAGSPESAPVIFDTALGGERAPDWDPRATGTIGGLAEAHGIGDIALAALEGLSRRLAACIEMVEARYQIRPPRLLLAGGPAKNRLWNHLTQVYTGKQTFATTFSDASLVGAAMIGYAACCDDSRDDQAVRERLTRLARLSARHPLISPVPVGPPDDECRMLNAK